MKSRLSALDQGYKEALKPQDIVNVLLHISPSHRRSIHHQRDGYSIRAKRRLYNSPGDQMNDATEILRLLLNSEAGDTSLDREVALLLGFKENGTSWTRPDGVAIRSLPRFTSDIQEALDLCNLLVNAPMSGTSWEQGRASAKLGNHRAYQARSPACAICVAVIAFKFQEAKGTVE